MLRIHCFILSFAVMLSTMTGVVVGQEKQARENKAQAVANHALADLAAWKNKSAKKYLKKKKEQFGSTPEFQMAWALLEIQEGADGKKAKVKRGMTDLSKMTKSQSVDAVASYYHGEILYQQDDREAANKAWQAAMEKSREIVEENPIDATAQFYLGASLVRTKDFEEARDALEVAAEEGFDPAMVDHQIGLSYLFDESYEKAKEALDRGLEAEPRYAPMYFWRAMAWEKLGRTDEMLLDLDQYVKLAPNGPYADKARAVLKSAGR